MESKKYFLTLDLENEEILIGEFEKYHHDVWPEIFKNVSDQETIKVEIHRNKESLVMITSVE